MHMFNKKFVSFSDNYVNGLSLRGTLFLTPNKYTMQFERYIAFTIVILNLQN
jgi:hypothetical protein